MAHHHDGVVVRSLGTVWSQADLGDEFDVTTLSLIGELDPSGAEGVVDEVLTQFKVSLEPMLAKFERHRAAGSAAGVLFEAHKLKSAAGQLGALRLSAACAAITRYLGSASLSRPDVFDEELGVLADALVWETIRVQRRLRKLLATNG